jgi:hypothetical protein
MTEHVHQHTVNCQHCGTPVNAWERNNLVFLTADAPCQEQAWFCRKMECGRAMILRAAELVLRPDVTWLAIAAKESPRHNFVLWSDDPSDWSSA